MPYSTTFLCLANSRKHGGRCIAGKVVTDNGYGAWIRPVSDRNGHEISDAERRCSNNTYAGVLDVITVRFRAPEPRTYQTENHVIDATQCWTWESRATWDNALAAVDVLCGDLWTNGSSSRHGLNDQVPANLANEFAFSLVLIQPEDLTIRVQKEGFLGFGKTAVRADFTYKDRRYRLKVTDVDVLNAYLAKGVGEYKLDEVLLCVSLGEEFKGNAYKLVAAVIVPPDGNG